MIHINSLAISAIVIIGSLCTVEGQSPPTCAVKGFFALNGILENRTRLVLTSAPLSSPRPLSRVFGEDFENKELNFEAEIEQSDSCEVKCVSLTLQNTFLNEKMAQPLHTVAPYLLFQNGAPKEPIMGVDLNQYRLKAASYNNTNCSGTPYSFLETDIAIYADNDEYYIFPPITVYYNGTSAAVGANSTETAAMINATCNYLQTGYRYQSTVPGGSLEMTQFNCVGTRTSYVTTLSPSDPLAITFRLKVGLLMSPNISLVANGNLALPSKREMLSRFSGWQSQSIGAYLCFDCVSTVKMQGEIINATGSANPYTKYTSTVTTVNQFNETFSLVPFILVYVGTEASNGTRANKHEVANKHCQLMEARWRTRYSREISVQILTFNCEAIGFNNVGLLEIAYQIKMKFSVGPIIRYPLIPYNSKETQNANSFIYGRISQFDLKPILRNTSNPYANFTTINWIAKYF
jgi:hypothetical protein